MKNCSVLKENMLKVTCALEVMKELCEILKCLHDGTPAALDCCAPDKLLGQQSCIEKALGSKQTENLAISWNVVEAADRKPMTLKEIEACYADKVKCRNEMFAKNAK